MGCTACTEHQCLYKGDLHLTFINTHTHKYLIFTAFPRHSGYANVPQCDVIRTKTALFILLSLLVLGFCGWQVRSWFRMYEHRLLNVRYHEAVQDFASWWVAGRDSYVLRKVSITIFL
jgi:hypothetical protein